MAFIHSPKVDTDGLVLYLDAANTKSYPGSGTTWTSVVGTSTATLTNGPTFSTTNMGNFLLDGVNDYIALPATIDTNSTFTLEFWALSSSDSSPTLFSGTPDTGYLQIRMATYYVSLVKSYITELGNFGATSGCPANQINHVVLTRIGTTYNVYTNGEQRGTLTIDQTYTTTNPTIGVNTYGTEYFSGRIYRFCYYNRALSATEILQNYNATRGRFGV